MNKREWATYAAQQLLKGNRVCVKPIGDSMKGRINSGDLVTLAPCSIDEIHVGDIVLAKIPLRRSFLIVLHLVIELQHNRLLIGNNQGRIDGRVNAEDVYGKVVQVHTEGDIL